MNDLNEEEIAKKWEAVARGILQKETLIKLYNNPEPVGALIKWRGNTYFGTLQIIVPDFSNEIVALSKASRPLESEFISAIRKLDPGRLELDADDVLDLEGRQHVLRRVENKLTHMTPDQTAYMLLHPPVIHEIS